MKTELVLISLLALAGVTLFFQGSDSFALKESQDANIFQSYVQWKAEFNQNFNGADDEYRFDVYAENYKFVQEHNAKSSKLVLGLNQFAAMTNEEFQSSQLSAITRAAPSEQYPTKNVKLPSSVDWVKGGAVTPIQNQGQCGSCWAFSTVGSVEGARFIEENILEDLSPQQLTSCLKFPLSLGCGGGNVYNGINYAHTTGLSTEAQYPYVQEKDGKTAACNSSLIKPVYKSGVPVGVTKNNTTAMKTALVSQPLSIAVDAGSIYFQLYKQGVIESDNCGIQLNHAILLVGYTDADNTWTVKNSWGTTWGLQGFAKILIKEGDGVCGINMDVVAPKLQN